MRPSTWGGRRAGAGRPEKIPGDIEPEHLLAALDAITSRSTIDALFADARAGGIASLRELARLYERARQDALGDRGMTAPMSVDAPGDLFERTKQGRIETCRQT